MAWRSGALRAARLAVLGALLAAGLAGPDASAQGERQRINVDVVVSHVRKSPPPEKEAEPGPSGLMTSLDRAPRAPRRVREIDERVRRIDAALRGRFVYDQIDLVEQHRMVLDLDEVGSVRLPNGQRFRLRPLDVGESGVLMAVDVGKSLKADVRARSGHLTIIGAQPYQDGQLVISVEPRY